ncbi:hypothetical protein NECAME_11103 [Necator americanus]|uniref:Uncharacterized protein n=1 Tax=Necator americanus TaxID=51031 RepID=W2T8R6_NECAM|nr:hypothetical protein NECAME_11103 [Necator americanus]ETN77377.1 hypothetical protein NECAME_11103 [Necator americanus]
MQYFNNTIEKRHDGYYVRLPFKKNCDTLPTNKTLAYRRLISVWNILKSNEDLLHQYHKETEESFAFSTIHVEVEKDTQFPLFRYATLIKSQRIIAWVLRFIRRCMNGLPTLRIEAISKRVPELRQTTTFGPLTGPEIQSAKQALIRNHHATVADMKLQMERIRGNQVLGEPQPATCSATLVDNFSQTVESCQMATDEKDRGESSEQAKIASNAEHMEAVEMEYEKARDDPKEAAIRAEIKSLETELSNIQKRLRELTRKRTIGSESMRQEFTALKKGR